MSEGLFDSAANQHRIRGLVTGITRVLFNPVVLDVINTPGARVDGIGYGLSEYRAGSDCLGSAPTRPGETPAEISFYPDIPQLGINGGIYWHGEGSNAHRRGDVLGFYLDKTLVEGRYVNYLAVRSTAGMLKLGHTDHTNPDLLPPTNALVSDIETKIFNLQDYVGELRR